MKKTKNKKQNNKNNSNTLYSMELKKLFIILSVIILVIAILYFIIGIFVTKDINLFGNKANDSEVSSTIQYREILAGQTFSMNKDEYYVIFTDSEGDYYSIYNNIAEGNTDKSIYLVDISNPLNNLFISDESNSSVQKASELKVKDNTLIKIQNGKNVEYIEDRTKILSYFN